MGGSLQSMTICHRTLPQCNSLSSHTEDTTSRTEVCGEYSSGGAADKGRGASYPNLLFSFKQDNQVLLLSHQMAINYMIYEQFRQAHHITQQTRKHNQEREKLWG